MTFEGMACRIATAAGRPLAFMMASAAIAAGLVAWLVLGRPEAFLNALNFGISIVTALMLFVLQSSSNRDGAAIQAKLDEIIRASDARDEFVGLDRRPASEIEAAREQ